LRRRQGASRYGAQLGLSNVRKLALYTSQLIL
jgi:hypothetical protein